MYIYKAIEPGSVCPSRMLLSVLCVFPTFCLLVVGIIVRQTSTRLVSEMTYNVLMGKLI